MEPQCQPEGLQQEPLGFPLPAGGGVGHPMVWLWGSVCDADLAPPKSLCNAGLFHSHWPTPPVVSLCPPGCSSGLGSWRCARQPGIRGSRKPCASLAGIPAPGKWHLLPMWLPGQQHLSQRVPCCGMDGLFLPVEEMLLSQCRGQTLPKGTEQGVLVGEKGWTEPNKLLQSQSVSELCDSACCHSGCVSLCLYPVLQWELNAGRSIVLGTGWILGVLSTEELGFSLGFHLSS